MGTNCAFCSREVFFDERVVYENSEAIVLATLGQITDGGHVLVAPKTCTPCAGAVSDSVLWKLVGLVHICCGAILAEWRVRRLSIFEHGVAGKTVPHAHLHILPAEVDFKKVILKDLSDGCAEAKIEKLQFLQDIRRLYKERNAPYLLWGDGVEYFVIFNPKAPPQYLRIIADAEVGNHPSRARWDILTEEQKQIDRQLCQETVRRIKPYFS